MSGTRRTEPVTPPADNLPFARNLPAIVGVLGGGRMGAGIAHAFLLNGCRVNVVERNAKEADRARERIMSSAAASVERGVGVKLSELDACLLTGSDDDLFSVCGLVVEAVPEDLDLKVAALAAIERRLGEDAYLATNTSSLSVDRLAEGLERPQNFLGLHFFNPVPASALIEVVVGAQTSDGLLAAARGWIPALGKTAVVVRDSPGFASTRLGLAIALESMRMLEEGVASAEDIDNAMVLGYRHPMGPLRTTDIVGLDVRLGIAEYLHDQLGDRFEPPQILRDKVAAGALGRKAGTGFFEWTA